MRSTTCTANSSVSQTRPRISQNHPHGYKHSMYSTQYCSYNADMFLVITVIIFSILRHRGDGGGGHSLVQMEWRPAGWTVCLPLLIFPCTIKSRSSLLAPAHPGGLGKRAVKRLWVWYVIVWGDVCWVSVCPEGPA